MTRTREIPRPLPQLDGGLFLTDGGLETTLIFHEGWDLPCFAAFVLLDSERGRKALAPITTATCRWRSTAGAGFVLESPTWRANPTGGPSSATATRRSRAAIAPRSS